jgi:hypothetical protein
MKHHGGIQPGSLGGMRPITTQTDVDKDTLSSVKLMGAEQMREWLKNPANEAALNDALRKRK